MFKNSFWFSRWLIIVLNGEAPTSVLDYKGGCIDSISFLLTVFHVVFNLTLTSKCNSFRKELLISFSSQYNSNQVGKKVNI